MKKSRSSFEEIFLSVLRPYSRIFLKISSNRLRTISILLMATSLFFLAIGIYFTVGEKDSANLIFFAGASFVMLTYSLFAFMVAKFKKRKEEAEESISKMKYSEFGDVIHKEYLQEEKDKYEFERNLKEAIILKSFRIEGLDFFGDFEWEFNPGINVLLGKNGYGKSYLLRLLAALLYKDEKKSRSFFEGSQPESNVNINLSRGEEWRQISRNSMYIFESIGKVPILAIPDMRYVNKSKTTIDIADTDSLTEDGHGGMSSNGATYFIYQQPYEAVIQTFLYQLCIDYLDHRKSFDHQIFRLVKSVVEELTGGKFNFVKIEAIGNAQFEMKVLAEADYNHPLPIQKASQGTLSVLAIFGLIYNYLRSVYPNVNDKELLDQTGIVIIDEIDAHLHPSWQQKIVGLLRKKYPNVQFILTAHNPLAIAGCYENEVSTLRKEDGGFFVEQYARDLIGASSEDIYKELFDVNNIDETYLRYATELTLNKDHSERIKQLKSKKELSKDEGSELVALYKETKRLDKVANLQKERNNKQYDMELETLRARIRELEYRLKGRGEVE